MASRPISESVRKVYAERAYGPIYDSQFSDPAKSARANELAGRLGIAPEIVEADFPSMMAEDRLRRRTAEIERNQAYARIMSNWSLARSGIDDDALPKVAETVASHAAAKRTRMRDLGVGGSILAYSKSLLAGIPRLNQGLYGALESVGGGLGEISSGPAGFGFRSIERWAGTKRKQSARIAEGIVPQTDSPTFNAVLMGGQSLAPSIGALIASATGHPYAAGAMMGGVTYGQSYGEARDEGLPVGRSIVYGVEQGVPEAGFEALGGRVFQQSIASGASFLKTLGRQVGIEIATEEPTTLVQSFNRFANIDRPRGKTTQEWVKELPREVLDTAIATASMVGLSTGASFYSSKAINRYLDVRHDQQAAERIDKIMGAAAASSTRTSNPTQFAEALNQLVGETDAEHVYIPAKELAARFEGRDGQPGTDWRDDPFWSRYQQQIEEAVQIGGDVVVPLAEFATHIAGTPQWAALREHVRATPKGQSIAERKNRNTDEELDRMAADAAGAIDRYVSSGTYRKVTAILNKDKKWAQGVTQDPEQARLQNQFLAAMTTRVYVQEVERAQRLGVEPMPLEQFVEQFAPQRVRMAQADYEAGIMPAGADTLGAATRMVPTTFASPVGRSLAYRGATLDGGNSNSPFMVLKPSSYDQVATSPEAAQGQEADAGGATQEPADSASGTPAGDRAQDGEEQLEFWPGADFGDAPFVFGEMLEVDGVDRPTENADGRPIAQTRRAIENFWRWFGDSQAVDEAGRPIVFYHGTKAQQVFSGFDADRTIFFSIDRYTAENFMDSQVPLIQAYLRINNPERYDAEGRMWYAVVEGEYSDYDIDQARENYIRDEMRDWAPSGEVRPVNEDGEAKWRVSHEANGRGVNEDFDTEAEALERLTELREAEEESERERLGDVEYWELEENEYLTREGVDMSADAVAQQAWGKHDAVWIDNVDEGEGATTVAIVLGEPRNIKSTGNLGTFDPDNPSMFNQTARRPPLQEWMQTDAAAFNHAASPSEQAFALGGFPLFQEKRGNISIDRDDDGLMTGALIRAFEASNFSTVVHELGHFYAEDLRRRATREGASEQEKADYATLLAYIKDVTGLDVAADQPIPVDGHELLARSVERYVFEGRAPSRQLKGLFARMREFMLKVYQSALSFNAPITPEVREVFDRMLASDMEIEEARAEAKAVSQAIGGLMTDEERTRYDELTEDAREDAKVRLFNQVLGTLRSERTAEARAAKAVILEETVDAVDQQPVMRALKLLRVGVPQDDGSFVRARIDRQWLTDTYGPNAESQMPQGVPPVVGDNDTIDADQAAELTGFSSGDEMIRSLMALEAQRKEQKASGDRRPVRQRQIDETVDRRYREEIGDPYENLEEEAAAAIANDRQADMLSMELRAIARKSGRKPTPWKLATEWARERLAMKKIKDALSGRAIQLYSRNAAKAAQEAEDALVKGDMDEAFSAKQRQLLQLALLQEARRSREAVDKAERRLRKIAGRRTMPSVDQDYLDQAHQLLEDVDLKNLPESQKAKRLAFEQWHRQQVALGVEPVVPPEYRSVLGKTPWSSLTAEEALELDAAVGQVIKLGRLKQKVRDGKEERDLNDAAAELEGQAETQKKRKQSEENDAKRTLLGWAMSRLRGIDAAMVKVEQMVDWLDGGDSNGPWNRLLFKMLADAQARENDLMRDYVERINGMVQALPRQQVKDWDRKVDTPELVNNVSTDPDLRGRPFVFWKDQVVMMAMNWGNEGNRQRLLDGFGWQKDHVEAVFDRLMTKQDWDFVQGVWNTVDGLWPEIEALERRVNGVAPRKVEATQVNTRHGTYNGGYFPAVYDPTYSTRVALNEADKLSPQGAWWQATTRAGSTRERAQAVKGRPLLLNMSVITSHIGSVIHDVTHREAVHQATKLLRDGRVRNAIDSRLGPEYTKAMEGWLENIATPNVADTKSNAALVNMARHLNKGISLAGLGFRISTILTQPLGFANIIGVVGEKAFAQGLAMTVAHPVSSYNEVISRSGEMRSRFQTMDANIEEMARQAAKGKLDTIGPKGLVKHAFDGILYADMLVTVTGWTAGFNKGLQQGMSEEEAAYYADKVIRTSQGAGGQKDRSAIMSANAFARSFWPFFSYLNALYNQQRDVFHRAVRGEIGEAARRGWWIMIVTAILQALIFGNGPDEEDEEGWAGWLTKSVMFGNISSIPGIGPIVNAIGSGYGYRSNAFQGLGEDITKSAKTDIAGVATGEEEIKGSDIKRVLSIVGVVGAKPLGQIGATSQGVYDYARGEAQPEDAGDWYELLTKGRVSPDPTPIERMLGEGQEEPTQ